MRKISVIIPVYNAEAFVRQCIQSLVSQTYQDWEALVIDDGSTDRSLAVCEELGRADRRIRVFHQENKGVSAARNYGLDLAGGEYVYFLDSDDAIHPLLLEEMMRQVEEHQVEMAFCDVVQVDDRQMDAALEAASPEDGRPQWQIGDGTEAERWFHIDHTEVLQGISGLVSRELIGPLRFDEGLRYGEDTMFKYFLLSKQAPAAYSPRQWYYYRINPQSISHNSSIAVKGPYSEQAILIRDREQQRGHLKYAVIWEVYLTVQLRKRYETCRKAGDKTGCGQAAEMAARECGHPLFRSIDLMHKALFYLCFRCYPLYVPVNGAAHLVWALKKRFKKRR